MTLATRTTITPVDGGVTGPAGIRAAGVASGIKINGLPDLAIVETIAPASTAAIFTTNAVKAAPVVLSTRHLSANGGRTRAIVTNSGCANACTGVQGTDDARAMAEAVARHLGCRAEEVLVASTGVIGVNLPMPAVLHGIDDACRRLSPDGGEDAARAIMTTDPSAKACAVRVETPAGSFRVGGMAKGSGMIAPRMATMLGYLTTDADVAPEMLHRALTDAARSTFNAITVDGETSTNDCVFAQATGSSGVAIDDASYPAFVEGLHHVAHALATAIVRGGEGATKLVTVFVSGAASEADAWRAARTIAESPLVKTAIHGGDPNWGRLVAAAGRSGARLEPEEMSVRVGPHLLFDGGQPRDERAVLAATYLAGDTVDVDIDLGTGGTHRAAVFTCDLSAEYVRINADYRT